MNYIRALIVSFLLHSLAFAGSYIFLNQFFAAHKTSSIQGPFLTVSLINETPALKASSRKESSPFVKKNEASKPIKGVETAVVSASSAHPQNSTEQESFEAKENGDGGANLMPHPENQPPHYPELARKKGLTGNMVLELTVNVGGRVDHVQVKEGHDTDEILQKTAIDAVKIWRFLYKTLPRGPIIIQVPVIFNLEA